MFLILFKTSATSITTVLKILLFSNSNILCNKSLIRNFVLIKKQVLSMSFINNSTHF